MSTITNPKRRQWLRRVGSSALAGTAVVSAPGLARTPTHRVVIVGGGFGGATAARYIKQRLPQAEVSLIEAQAQYYTCPFSNLYLGGLKDFDELGHDFSNLAAQGIRVITDLATAVDTEQKRVHLAHHAAIHYDKLLLAPGIDFKWNALEGYDEAASLLAPHAWKTGPQTQRLKKQLEAMPDGGLFILVAPENPFRCPPGPYERVSMIAHYFKQHKPRSKILILDAKDAFSKQALFQQGWQQHYGSMIEWIPFAQDGKVVRVDANRLQVETEFGTVHQADVLNVIPPQQAGAIAVQAGVTDNSGWVPVDGSNFASQQVADVYVVGDASIASPMPKSGFAANAQAKVAATAIVNDLLGQDPAQAFYANTCYSLIAPHHGISVANAYVADETHVIETSGGVSPLDGSAAFRQKEADYGAAWYKAISQDIWNSPLVKAT